MTNDKRMYELNKILNEGKMTIDIDFMFDGNWKADLKKFNLTGKPNKKAGSHWEDALHLTGKKEDIIKYLTTDYGMDAEDAREIFPELYK